MSGYHSSHTTKLTSPFLECFCERMKHQVLWEHSSHHYQLAPCAISCHDHDSQKGQPHSQKSLSQTPHSCTCSVLFKVCLQVVKYICRQNILHKHQLMPLVFPKAQIAETAALPIDQFLQNISLRTGPKACQTRSHSNFVSQSTNLCLCFLLHDSQVRQSHTLSAASQNANHKLWHHFLCFSK